MVRKLETLVEELLVSKSSTEIHPLTLSIGFLHSQDVIHIGQVRKISIHINQVGARQGRCSGTLHLTALNDQVWTDLLDLCLLPHVTSSSVRLGQDRSSAPVAQRRVEAADVPNCYLQVRVHALESA